MVRGRARRLAGIAILAVVIVVSLGAGTAGAARRARWRLVDYDQSGCFSQNVHDSYYGVFIKGRWTRPIDVGAAGLPAGGTYDTSYAPIPPGSSSGEYSLASVHIRFEQPPPVGTYTASMWASDGRTTREVPVTLDVRSRCGY
jgi:uncharacterized protein DUF5980